MSIWASLFLFLLLNYGFSQPDVFIYNGFSLSNLNNNNTMSLNGPAEIQKNGVLRLTNETDHSIGHAFYPFPLQFKNSSTNIVFSFSTSFAFAIVPPKNPKLGGHGLAFAISPSKELTGAFATQYFGIFTSTNVGNSSDHIFAMEFDTLQDLDLGDINNNHVGVDINSVQSICSVPAAYFVDRNTLQDLMSGKMIQAWVDYDGVNSVVNALFMPYDHRNRTPDGLASHIIKSMLEDLNHLHCQNGCLVGSGGGSVGYLAHGTSTDYMFDIIKVPMSFTVEVRTFKGHTNEKNFVGLMVNNEYIACGSETNEVFIYHKAISKPAAWNRFSSSDMDGTDDDAASYFISAVCWKSDSPTMLTANSQGTIKVLVLAA